MNNETIKKIKSYEINIDENKKQDLICIGKQNIINHQLSRHSLVDLFKSSLRFTRIHTWIIQLSLLIFTVFFITEVISDEPFIYIIQSLSIVVVVSVMFFIDELFRSFTTGMWELEQTLKYDLRQHTIMKLLIFGLTDLVIILCLAFISQGIMAISFWKIVIYLLVPFNITCIILFSLFTIWRNNLSSIFLWINSGVVLMFIMIVSNVFNVYELGMVYWGAGFTVSTIILAYVVINMIQVKKWEVY